MSMVQCRFCGQGIADTDTVCKHCGRVLGTQTAVHNLNKSNAGYQNAAQTAVAVKVIPDAMPEKKEGFMSRFSSDIYGKILGLSLPGGLFVLISMIAELVQLGRFNEELLLAGVGLLAAYFLVIQLRIGIQFLRVKKMIRKQGYETAIRNDTPMIENALAAYRLSPSFWMVRYIKKRNVRSGEIIGSALEKRRKENTNRRLGYVPSLLFLAVAFGGLGYLQMDHSMEETVMFVIMEILAFFVNLFYCRKMGKDKGLMTYTVILFFAALVIFTEIDYSYHALICAVAVFLGSKLGERMHR